MASCGVQVLEGTNLDAICREREKAGWKVFFLPNSIESAKDFVVAIQELLPLDPPLFSESNSWDAISDSLWGGVHALQAGDVLIVWPSPSRLLTKDPFAHQQIVSVFESISRTLQDPKYGAGQITRLLVYLCD